MNQDMQKYLLQKAQNVRANVKSEDWIRSIDFFSESLKNIPVPKQLQIKDYKILQELGSGAFGKVYKAQVGKKQVILKQISLDFGYPHLLQTEKHCLIKLKHKAVLGLVSCWYERDVFIATEYCVGDLWQHRSSIDVTNGYRFIVQLLEAADFVHQNRILHRDWRLPNILLTPMNNIKISEFGLALELNKNEDWRIVSEISGAFEFLPKESLQQKLYSKSGEMHMLGCCIYEIDTHCPLVYQRVSIDHPKIVDRIESVIETLQSGRKKEVLASTGWEFVRDKSNTFVLEPIGERIKKSRYYDLLKSLLDDSPSKRISAKEALNHPILQEMERKMSCQIYNDSSDVVIKNGIEAEISMFDANSFEFVTKQQPCEAWDICLLNFCYDAFKTTDRTTNTNNVYRIHKSTSTLNKTPFLDSEHHKCQENVGSSDVECLTTKTRKRARKLSFSSSSDSEDSRKPIQTKKRKTIEYICRVCKKTFASKGNQIRHESSHEDKKYNCPTCQAVFRRKDYLENHIKTQHIRIVLEKCTHCGKELRDRANIFHHKKICPNGTKKHRFKGLVV